MNKTLNIEQAAKLSSSIRKKNKTLVLVGGVFDILHVGHIRFLEKAKIQGDYLFVLLESDKSVKKLKGLKRPINTQKDRAEILQALNSVDFVVALRGTLKNKDYDKIVKKIGPNVLATSAGDSYIFHKKRQAKLVDAKLKIVIKRIKNKSTSNLLKS